MSKAPRECFKEKVVSQENLCDENKVLEECGYKLIERQNLNGLYNAARKYYLRVKRAQNGNGIEENYMKFINETGFTREHADKLYYNYLKRKYPELVKFFHEQIKKE